MLLFCLPNSNIFLNDVAPAKSADQVVVLVPTCNPGPQWDAFLAALVNQHPRPAACVVIDSSSTDGSDLAAEAAGLTVHRIERANFNHGRTRQEAVDRFAGAAEFVVFLTQDAILAEPTSVHHLLQAFDDPTVAAVYGRQLPHADATPLARHARLFNYPEKSHTSRWSDVQTRGFKACFLSNAFAAYRVKALQEAGGFAKDLILGEDTQLAARLIQAGHAVRYHAFAQVYHSHNYTFMAEFRRYFDTGVFHAQQSELMAKFGGAGREGLRFIVSEAAYLFRHAPLHLPEAACRTFIKALAYQMGKKQALLPRPMRRYLSMTKGYWA